MLLACVACTPEQLANVDYVDPFIGTGFHGHTYPGATVPHGAVQLSPDTRAGNWDACAGYHYGDQTLKGLAHPSERNGLHRPGRPVVPPHCTTSGL